MIQTVAGIANRCIQQALSARETIRAAYLFGSVLDEDRFKSSSDIDLAFLLKNFDYAKDPLTASYNAYHISTQVSFETGRRTDVVILNAASVETAYQVITTGELLYEKDGADRLEYEIALKGMYFDFKPFLDELRSGKLIQT
ncbi:MAG: nucleotidyltransferase domain-containing protein [Desulfobacteraceae bacterium]|nr:nucleotidyltransferase domain-containing protein [Desulfobacteraceae bacterium]